MNRKYATLRRLPLLLGFALGVLLVLAWYFWQDKFKKPPQIKKLTQHITMIQPPPPPPPVEQKQPEPENKEQKLAEQEMVPMPETEPKSTHEEADEPPTDQADGNGDSAPEGWNMQSGEVRIGGGAGGNSILWYGGQIQRRLEDGLQPLLADTAAIKTAYSVIIDVWVDANGSISRSELSTGSGKADVDAALSAALPKLRAGIGKPPPEHMPQPVKIRFTARI